MAPSLPCLAHRSTRALGHTRFASRCRTHTEFLAIRKRTLSTPWISGLTACISAWRPTPSQSNPRRRRHTHTRTQISSHRNVQRAVDVMCTCRLIHKERFECWRRRRVMLPWYSATRAQNERLLTKYTKHPPPTQTNTVPRTHDPIQISPHRRRCARASRRAVCRGEDGTLQWATRSQLSPVTSRGLRQLRAERHRGCVRHQRQNGPSASSEPLSVSSATTHCVGFCIT